jgi:hypothetical protein
MVVKSSLNHSLVYIRVLKHGSNTSVGKSRAIGCVLALVFGTSRSSKEPQPSRPDYTPFLRMRFDGTSFSEPFPGSEALW